MVTREQMVSRFGRAFAEVLTASVPAQGIERFKLDRLLELRAVIASLRDERNPGLRFDTGGALSHDHR